MRCGCFGSPVYADVGISEVVSKQDDDIRTGALSRLEPAAGGETQRTEGKHSAPQRA